MVTGTLVTAEQFYEMPDDDLRHDLVDGEVWTKPLPGGAHGKIAMRLGYLLYAHVESRQLGEVAAAETGYVLARNPDTVLGQDVAFVQAVRVPPDGVPKKHWPIAPDRAVEVVSPGDREGEIAKKVARYLRAGTQMVWVLYPERRTVVVHELSGARRTLADGDALDGGAVELGFSCPVSALWS